MPPRRAKPQGGKTIEVDLGSANEKQALFYASKTLYTAYGGARGGGKSHAVRTLAIKGALEYRGIKILIVRRTYGELEENHILPIIQKVVPLDLANYRGDTHTLTFINGSSIKFGHYQGVESAAEYHGKEYDWVFVDEATQFTEMQFRTLGACVRGVNEFPKRTYLTCNPGGVGHQWVKRLFIDRKYKTNNDNPEEDENPEDYSFIAATVEDNVHLMRSNNRQYIQMLSALPENIRKAHRYGDWDALGGQYFPEFTEARHVIKPFPIPKDWMRYRSFDYGLDMLACYWTAVSPNGRAYVYRECTESGLIVSDAAERILSNTIPGERIVSTFAPPDIWSTMKDTGKTMAELFMQCGVGLVKSSNNRVQGHLLIKEMLSDMVGGKPALMIFNTCPQLISDLKAIQSDDKNPNDCAKQPHEITHTVDALRYYCIMRVLPGTASIAEVPEEQEDGIEDYDDFMTGGYATEGYLNYG